MGDKEDYLTSYRVFFENFAATVNPEDQLPVHIAGYTITEAELPGEVIYWTTQYLTEKQCPLTLMTPLRRIILEEVRVESKKQPSEFGYKSDESVYIALRLMQAVTARVNAVCLRYLDNSKLDTLPPPPLNQRDLKTVSIATKNSRRVMEDRHIEIGNLDALFGIESTEATSFYAVYDGHAGSAAATYCAAHLHQYLVESAHYMTDLPAALKEAFLRTDTDFVRKSNQERACGGSTAVVIAVRGQKLVAAWAGDSLALLAKRMRLMQLVRPHKPGREDERDRIESSGGTVMYWGTWRVNGQLAVSRAIGDAQYKPYVTARPEIASVDLDRDEDFVVVACDGLWDFVSEDDVALAVYRQVAADPDDLKAVTKRLVLQAKRQGSGDNISIIVVFLKDPRDIAVDNCLPMDLGLDNVLANAPPFVMETEACKRLDAAGVTDETADCNGPEGDNGVDHSDSDSEDLGPETAVDADDLDADLKNHEPAPPTPPAHTVEENHVDGGLVDNVAESGEESEDEWNYFKGEGEPEAADEPTRSETPFQDNSAWETSSVDMNSSPLNPDAPPFVPGTAGDVLLAESPRKPLPMDDIELPDVAQFRTEAVVRPAELLDLDNCDQLNGHHNVSIDDAAKEHLNGNNKCMDSLGFGFSVGLDPGKDTSLIQDFERIQKDTTDFCNLQVFQAQPETNPFAPEGDEELLERLKNKERDPMSMSFYQEKDDDTCERHDNVDLNAVQTLPDSDDEDLQTNGDLHDKENISPHDHASEPDNDILRFDDRNDNVTNPFGQDSFDNTAIENITNTNFNMQFESSNIQDVPTPESHKLLFEQIPEIPDGKSSELGFAINPLELVSDALTPQDDTSQDVDMESKIEDSPCEESKPVPAESQDEIEPAPASPLLLRLEERNEVVSEPIAALLNGLEEAERQEGTRDERDVTVDIHPAPEGGHDLRPGETSPAPVLSPSPPPSPTPVLSPSPAPVLTPSPVHSPAPVLSPSPAHSPAPVLSPSPAPSPAPVAAPYPAPSHPPVAAPFPTPSPALEAASSPCPAVLPAEDPAPRLSPAPTPDLLSERRVTDIDEPVAESRAQEICLPITSVIPQEDFAPAAATLPPTPAHDTLEPALALAPAPLSDTPIAADLGPRDEAPAVAAAAVTVAAGVATAAAAVAATKMSATPIKKSAATPKPAAAALRTTPSAPRTPASAKKAAAPLTASPRTALAAKTTPARTASAPVPAPKPSPARPAARSAPLTRPAAARPAPAPSAAKPAPGPRAAPASARPAARPAPARAVPLARPATAPTAPRPVPRPAPARPASATVPARPKPLDKKPLTNGDMKPATRPAAPRPAPATTARPTSAPKAPPSAPKAPPRAAASATAVTALKSASAPLPRPAPRRSAPARPVASAPAPDKLAKDLTNKRITSKTAPSRTTAPKASAGTKNAVSIKGSVKKAAPAPAPAPVTTAPTAPTIDTSQLNGAADTKPPLSPPPADNALLPDVIA